MSDWIFHGSPRDNSKRNASPVLGARHTRLLGEMSDILRVCRAGDETRTNSLFDGLRVAIPLGLIILFPICFMWQGLDVTDTGYSLANMQQFFDGYPKDVTDPAVSSCWLTFLIGGVWYRLTGSGLFGFRVLYLLITFCIVGLAWLPTRVVGRSRSLVALLAGSTMVIGQSFYFPSYNEMTALFFMLAAVALFYGLVNSVRFLIFLAGAAAGISVFARLPNVAIAGIIVAILYFRASESIESYRPWKASAQLALRECTVFSIGYLTGIGAVLLVMAALGHVAAYVQMLHHMSAMVGDPTQDHGGSRLFRGLLHDYFYSGLAGIAFAVGATVLGLLAARYRDGLFRWLLVFVVMAGLTVMVLVSNNIATYFWPGLINTILVAGAFGFLNLNKEYRLLCVLAGVVFFMTPLGSNNGIVNSVYAMSLAVPVALIALITRPCAAKGITSDAAEEPGNSAVAGAPLASVQNNAWLFPRYEKLCNSIRATTARLDTAAVGYVILWSMVAFSAAHRWNFTFRDSPNRLAMRATVNHMKLREVFTTVDRARSLEGLLKALQPLVRKGDYLLDHMQVPMIYFLTEAKPYLYSTWANLYEPSVFERMIQKAVAARSELPVCVRTKVDTSHPEWPCETYPLAQSHRFVENRRLIESFLQVHNYQKHWENNAFEIWLPPPSKRNG